MIVIFTEERSMSVTIKALMQSCFSGLTQGVDWLVIDFNGKSDLERNFPDRMRKWTYGDPSFIIIRDADGGDCIRIKNQIAGLAADTGKAGFKVRIVCQELESWFIGDGEAVRRAFPRCRFSNRQSPYRAPDRIGNPSQELGTLTGDYSKVQRAGLIAPHLAPSRNASPSFRTFFKTLSGMLNTP